MAKHSLFLFYLVTLGLLIPEIMNAQTDNATMRLDEVVVTAGRFKELKQEVTTHVTVIDEQEIRLSSAGNLGDLLAETNIGHIQKYPGALTSIGIRGLRTDSHGNDLDGKVLILLNGRRAGTGNVAKILTENIERIEIIRGPASVQYGSAAIGGLVNVITKQGQGEPSLSVQGELGSFGYDKLAANFSGAAKGFDFSGNVSRSSMDDYNTADGEKYDNTGYDELVNLSLNLGYECVPRNRFAVIYTGFDVDQAGNPSYLSQNDLDDFNNKSNESIDFIYEGADSENRFSWKVRYFTGEDKNTWYDPTGSDPNGWDTGESSKTTTDQQGAQGQLTWSPGAYRLTAGTDWVSYKIDSDLDPVKTEYDNPSFFVLGKAKYFQDRLIISGGLRYDEFEVKLKKGQGGREKDANISPGLGLSYLPKENIKLRAHYGQGFKMPGAQQLAGDYLSFYGQLEGNPDLDPEKSETYEAGVDLYFGAFDASLTVFHTMYKDKIEQVAGAGGVLTWDNVGEAKFTGFEGEISYDLAGLWNWSWQIKPYVNLTRLLEFEDKETGDNLLYTSDLNLSYGIIVSDLEGFSARLNMVYVGEQKVQDWESSAYPTPIVKKGGYNVANISIQKKILDFQSGGDLSLRGEVRNLLDKDYAHVKGYPMPGRNFILGVNYTF